MNFNEYSKQEKANEESLKLGYDLFKHITTLSTGTLLILITFLEKLFQNPTWKVLVSISFVSLTLVIMLSTILMFMVTAGVGELGKLQEHEYKWNRWMFLSTVFFFIVGILSFVVFALINFNK